jgi:outer membrane protein assembly factor BamB
MLTHPTSSDSGSRSLRVWPAVLLAALGCVLWLVLPRYVPALGMYWFLGWVATGAALFAWWTFASRATRPERWLAPIALVVGLFLLPRFLDASVTGAGQGMLFYFSAVPIAGLALAAAAVVTARAPVGVRRATVGGALALSLLGWAFVRVEGIRGEGGLDTAWRWSPTAEERLLEQEPRLATALASAPVEDAADAVAATAPSAVRQATADEPADLDDAASSPASGEGNASAAIAPAEPAPDPPAAWPGFRGPARDGVVRGLRVATDWTAFPPVELWRRAVGPAWSSFAIGGDRLYTQEQRGEEEVVSSYELATGEPVWMHADLTRFWEANAGAGPRGTPTLDGDRVYAFGATGILNALDARTGALAWSRNVATDVEIEVPYWGFASSPLVVGDVVVVAASGRLAAYDVATGSPRWIGPARGSSYASPHLLTIDGTTQVALLGGKGPVGVSLADGTVVWEHAWPGGGMLQPAALPGGDLLVTTSDMSGGAGTRRLAVGRGADGGFRVEERWTSRGLKPYFSDLVVHGGHAYGFDGTILACIDLEDGERAWKGGRYGSGQLVLLPEQDLLLVLSERGELALVAAAPDGYRELARVPAIEGKTWNHPAVAGDVLLVRNAEEMAAFRLAGSERGE